MPIVGWASMRVRIGTVEVEIPVTVAHIKNDSLIGMDFLSLTECVIDTRRRQLNFGEGVVQGYTEENRLFCGNITVSKRFDIPPGHERVILGRINRRPDMQGFGVVEPGDNKLTDSGGIVARAVVDLDKFNPNQVPIRVFNPTLKKLTVTKKTTIVTVSPIVTCGTVQQEPNDSESTEEIELEITAHLVELYEASIKEIPVEQHVKVAKLLIEYQDVFSTGDRDLGRTGVVKHRIKTGVAPPNRQRPQRLAPTLQEEADRQIKDMLDRGIIEPSKSPWASPIVLVTKKDGTRRFCTTTECSTK